MRLAAPAISRQTGFTVVELVTVIAILGILAIGTVRFIDDSSRGFAATVGRAELAADARALVERLSREVKHALPGSIRVSGSCLEFVPVFTAARYVTLPVAMAAASFRSAPLEIVPPADARVAVYPNASAYALTDPGPLSPAVTGVAAGSGGEVVVSLAESHRFSAESPARRYFLVSTPVSYCVAGDSLYRYSGYGFHVTQPGPADLPSGLPGRSLVAQHVSAVAPFSANGATLARNAVVAVDLTLARNGDTVRMAHSVQVRNVP